MPEQSRRGTKAACGGWRRSSRVETRPDLLTRAVVIFHKTRGRAASRGTQGRDALSRRLDVSKNRIRK